MRAILFLTIGSMVGGIVGVTIGGVAMHFLYSPFFGETPMSYHTIYFPKANTKIYALARIWGITGNHEEVRLCSAPYRVGDSNNGDECVVFFSDRIYYKKLGSDGLQIYAPSSAVPPNIKSSVGSIRLFIKEMKSFDDIKDLERNFEDYGLLTIAAP